LRRTRESLWRSRSVAICDPARQLNRVAQSVFDEASIFRIDHFLGKEAIMNIL
jgi:glucose-6-phosphate 1-dehydrogenase